MASYSMEENQYILETVTAAKELGLDLIPVFIEIADKLERSHKAIELKYYYLSRKKSPSSEDSNSSKPTSVLNKLKILVKERDKYKESFDILKDQRDEYKKELDALKKEHEKTAKELAELLEIIDNI